MLNETQIIKDSLIEDINNIINISEVPNMMFAEDWEEICYDLRAHYKD